MTRSLGFPIAAMTGILFLMAIPLVRGGDLDEDGVPDELEQQLIDQYRPFLYFDSGESHWPASVEWYVQNSELRYNNHIDMPDDATIYTLAQLANDPLLILRGGEITGVASTTASQPNFDSRWSLAPSAVGRGGQSDGQGHPYHVGTYARVIPLKAPINCPDYPELAVGPGQFLVQYYQLFGFNDYSSVLGSSGGNHDGDWLILDVYVDKLAPYTLRYIVYHHHGDGNCGPTVLSGPSLPSDGVPRCSLEQGAHEWWPFPSYLNSNEDCGNGLLSARHDDFGPAYRTENVLNLGEHFAPMGGVEALLAVLFNGLWGNYGGTFAQSPPGPMANNAGDRCFCVYAPPYVVYVDSSAAQRSGVGLGSRYFPYAVFSSAVSQVETGGRIRVAAGSYPGSQVLTKPLTLQQWGIGPATIGR